MKETIERLRLARIRAQAVIENSTKDDAEILRKVARDIHTSITELHRVQAAVDAIASMSREPQPRKTCTCGVVNVTSGLRGYTEYTPGLADPQCPIHGNSGVVIANV